MPKMWEDNNTFQFVRITTHTLKVHMHCEGCMKKVKKILQKIEGVYEVQIEAEEHKVTVSGDVKCITLIKKLAKSGKHAEIWPSSLTNQLKDDDYLKQMIQSMMNNNSNSYESMNPVHEDDINNWILANHLNNNDIENMQGNIAISGWKENLINDKSFMEGDTSWFPMYPGFGELARPKTYNMGMPTYKYYGQPPATMNAMQGPWDHGAYNPMLHDMQNLYPVSNVMANNYVHQPRMMTTMPSWEKLSPITDQYWNN